MKAYVLKGILAIILCYLLLLSLMSILPSHTNNHDNNLVNVQTSDENYQILQRIDRALSDIQILKRNNDNMRRVISHSGNHLESKQSNIGESTFEYEQTRRETELNLKEMWYTIRSKSGNIPESEMEQISDIYRILRGNLMKLRAEDGYEGFRDKETEELSRIVQERLHALQNPKNCDKAKKLICTLNKGCGFGCQVHHVCYCLLMAYGTGRTLILESRGWRYNRQGWEKVFYPISDTCLSSSGEDRADWANGKSHVQVLQLPIVDFIKPKPPFLPISIPSDISERLEKIHGEPHIWWVGQFMKYLLRIQPETQAMIDESKSKLGFSNPIVGVHIRRTDKIGTEASFHSLKEYMVHAEEYFSILEKAGDKVERKVFIASDDPGVISEAQKAYKKPEWTILGDPLIAQSASVSQRYSGLVGIIKDVFLLAECDFVVCTFSSQVCRLAYELIQTKHSDYSQRFVSLDDVYYYGGGSGLNQKVVLPHSPRNANELELKIGDMIGVAGNHWNGMSKGTNKRTNKIGLYPSYKARNEIRKVDFPRRKWWDTNSKEI